MISALRPPPLHPAGGIRVGGWEKQILLDKKIQPWANIGHKVG